MKILDEDRDHFKCIVMDDGVGIEKTKQIYDKQSSKEVSHGMALTEKKLNQQSGVKLDVAKVHPDAANPGTKVTLIYPKKTKAKRNLLSNFTDLAFIPSWKK